MTEDGAALVSAVEGASYPSGSTDTTGALAMADQMLHTAGRTDVPRDDTIVVLITDGAPNNIQNAIEAAKRLHDRAELVVVGVGSGVDPMIMAEIATDPSHLKLVE